MVVLVYLADLKRGLGLAFGHICCIIFPQKLSLFNTTFPLYRIGFYNVKTIQYNENRIGHTTLYNATCFH